MEYATCGEFTQTVKRFGLGRRRGGYGPVPDEEA